MSENRKSAGIHSQPVENSSDAKTNTPKAHWCAIPGDVGGRIGMLFITVCLIKLTMLVGFRRYLFEIQWRIGSWHYNWVNEAAFYAFAVLVGLSLWQFAMRCSAGGAPVVRAANAGVLLAGIFFIFLTFHAGDTDYLYLVMHGTLTWWDLRWYLIQVFFFQPPFLAVWMFVYALLYYGLVRTGREQRVLYFTAIFAPVYIALFFHEFIAYQNALLVADSLGVACLLAGAGSRNSPGWFWMIQPWLWCVFLFLLFRTQDDALKNLSARYFVLSGWSIALFLGLSILAWRRKFHAAWLWLLPFAFTSFLLLVNINYGAVANFQNLLCLGFTLPHYFLGEFFLALTLLAAATVYRRLLPSASLLWLDGINLLLIALALADLRLTQIMGVRLDWQAVEFGADFKMVWREAKPYLPEMIFGLVILAGLYAVLVGLWQRESSSRLLQSGRSGQFCLISFLLLGIAGNWFAGHDKAEGQSAILLATTSPLFKKVASPTMDEKTFILTAKQLGMETMTRPPAPTSGHAPRNLNVLLIFQESSYNKYLSLFNGTENTEPLLSKYTDRMELFPDFFCNFSSSIYARFATLTGLYPVKDYKAFTYHRVKVSSIFEVLRQNSYQCSLFDSCFLDYTGFRDFLRGRGIDAMYDADTMPGRREKPVSWGLREEETLRAIQAQIKQYATNHQKFFLSYFPVAPHNPFDGIPRQFQKYSLKQVGDYTPLYLNNLLYMDWIVASILDELKDAGLLDNTLVIITDDHGEMLGENGGPVGHGWTVTPGLANIPLIIMDPDKPGCRINDTVGSQVDLLPTILDLLGIPIPQDQLYQGASLYSDSAQTDRTIYLNSFLQYGIIQGRRLACGNQDTEVHDAATSSPTKVFAIVNDGAHTTFPETNSLSTPPPSISQFDKFQENFLQNYSHYCQTAITSP
jgi:phosphoglycerol transferase MdoB-like AlkP superfamily enzyme